MACLARFKAKQAKEYPCSRFPSDVEEVVKALKDKLGDSKGALLKETTFSKLAHCEIDPAKIGWMRMLKSRPKIKTQIEEVLGKDAYGFVYKKPAEPAGDARPPADDLEPINDHLPTGEALAEEDENSDESSEDDHDSGSASDSDDYYVEDNPEAAVQPATEALRRILTLKSTISQPRYATHLLTLPCFVDSSGSTRPPWRRQR